jgi:hypothetical protein
LCGAPNFAWDAAAGVELYRKEQRSARFQIQAANLNDRLNVINFASLFSGTAVAAPRSVSARLRMTFQPKSPFTAGLRAG